MEGARGIGEAGINVPDGLCLITNQMGKHDHPHLPSPTPKLTSPSLPSLHHLPCHSSPSLTTPQTPLRTLPPGQPYRPPGHPDTPIITPPPEPYRDKFKFRSSLIAD